MTSENILVKRNALNNVLFVHSSTQHEAVEIEFKIYRMQKAQHL